MATKTVLVIGGAGFIGINAAKYYLEQKYKVIIFDNFSRQGAKKNTDWLQSLFAKTKRLELITGDIRTDHKKLLSAVKKSQIILHLAGQVAVTTSVHHPVEDFEVNAQGTLNVLEAVRKAGHNPILLYSSTNKVYGGLDNVKVKEKATRYEFRHLPLGVDEHQNLDFHSPYGCSKGAADQYVRDYHRMYGLNTIVFRQSCIYGLRQFGMEDQGWVAWFIIALAQNKAITIYGNGKQVRDLLFVDDLIQAYDLAITHIDTTRGQIYNVGGGPKNTLSVWYEFRPMLEKLFGRKMKATFADERPGDQPIFVANIKKASRDFGWKPKVKVEAGIEQLYNWVVNNLELFSPSKRTTKSKKRSS